MREYISQNVNLIEDPSYLPFTYIGSLQMLSEDNKNGSGQILLPRTARTLAINGLLKPDMVIAVETEHFDLRRLQGVILNPLLKLIVTPLKIYAFMEKNDQFARFTDRLNCYEITNQPMIDDIFKNLS